MRNLFENHFPILSILQCFCDRIIYILYKTESRLPSMNEWNIFEQDKIKLLGRSDRVSGGFHMDWTGSCVEFVLQGCYAQVEMTAVNDGKEQWVLFEIDGIPSARIRLMDGTHWYTILNTKGYPQSQRIAAGARRSIRIFKESQANYGDKNATTSCERIRVDGELCDPPVRPRIEFIGDSLTSGEGAISPRFEDIESAISLDEWSTSYYAWPGYTARILDADFQIFSQGGWGVYCGWDNNMITNLPFVYDRICGIIQPPFAAERGADKLYDFSFNPDVIVINLGTNDNSGFNQPAWRHPVTGKSFKLRRSGMDSDSVVTEYPEDDSDYVEEDKDKVMKAIVDFVKLIAHKNPGTPVFWIYGMMGHALWPTIQKAKDILHRDGFTQFDTVLLPEALRTELGANSHPLAVSHRICAHAVAERIRAKLIK